MARGYPDFITHPSAPRYGQWFQNITLVTNVGSQGAELIGRPEKSLITALAIRAFNMSNLSHVYIALEIDGVTTDYLNFNSAAYKSEPYARGYGFESVSYYDATHPAILSLRIPIPTEYNITVLAKTISGDLADFQSAISGYLVQ